MPDPLLAIGPFSRASFLSVKALRAYHEAGILVPAVVDPVTGYRHYHPSQLTDAAILRRLRQLDLPLADVAAVLQARDPDATREILRRHESTMRERLRDAERIVAELQEGIVQPGAHTPVHVRDLQPELTLAVRASVTESDFAAFLGDAFARLSAAVTAMGAVASGPSGALYPHEISDDGAEPVEAYLPILAVPDRRRPGSVHGVVLSELPATSAAVLTHLGPYDTISESYRRLGEWVGHHAEPGTEPVRESYLVSYAETDDPALFRTEIQWPVRPEAGARSHHDTREDHP